MRKSLAGIVALLVLLVPGAVSANSYGGTVVQPSRDGETYSIQVRRGEKVVLDKVGTTGGQLKLKLGKDVQGSVAVRETKKLPAGVTEMPSGVVQTYFDVELIGFDNSDVTEATWQFNVGQDWLNSSGSKPDKVVLHHHNGSAWETLPTRHISTVGGQHTFESQVYSFSPFAIAATADTSSTGIGSTLWIVLLPLAFLGVLAVLLRKPRVRGGAGRQVTVR